MLVLTGAGGRRGPIASALAFALALAPGPVRAEEPGTDPLAEAKAAHARAQAEYETAAYDRAIESWTAAYAALPDSPESATYRPLILYNIARAREKLFSLRGDVTHLKQARALLEKFEAAIPEVYADDPAEGEAEREKVRAKIAELDAKIAEAEGDRATEPTAAATEPVAAPPSTPEVEPQSRRDRADPRARPLIAVGAVLVALGVAGFGGMGGALAVGEQANDIDDLAPDDLAGRESRFDRGRRANAAAIAMGVVSPLLLGAGVALLVVGAKRKGRAAAIAPVVSPRLVGASISGRF
jgi:hypothetical protein